MAEYGDRVELQPEREEPSSECCVETSFVIKTSHGVDVTFFCMGTTALLLCCVLVYCLPSFDAQRGIEVVLPVALLTFPLFSVFTDFFQSRLGVRLSLILSFIILMASLPAYFSLGYTWMALLLEIAFMLLSVQMSSFLEYYIDYKKYGMLSCAVYATASIVILLASSLSEMTLCLAAIVVLLFVSLVALLQIRRISQSGKHCLVDKAESKKRSSDQRMGKRLVCIGSWGFGFGIVVAALLVLSVPLDQKVAMLGVAAFIAAWLTILLRLFSDENAILPRFAGAILISVMMWAFFAPGFARQIGVVVGIAVGFVLLGGIVGALSERTRVDGVSAIWLFGSQIGFWSAGAVLGVAISAFATMFVPGQSLELICSIGVVLTAFAQILVGSSEYPSDDIVVGPPERGSDQNLGASDCVSDSSNMGYSRDTEAEICEYAKHFDLSPRQTEVLGLLVRGRNIRFIADRLCVSESTIKTHVHNLYSKLGVHSQQELITHFEETREGSESK